MDFDLQPVLKNEWVALRPLKDDDFDKLFELASDPLIWEQHQNKDRYRPKEFTNFFNGSLESKGALIILDSKSNTTIGSSRFKVVDPNTGVVEIGWSFLSRKYWGGFYNREVKKIMINYALRFTEKVVFYVNSKNFRSQRALEKLGAIRVEDHSKPWVLSVEKGVTFVIDGELK